MTPQNVTTTLSPSQQAKALKKAKESLPPLTVQVGKLTPEQFFHQAIVKLRNTEKSKGIHTVFTGFNEAYRTYFGEGSDPVAKSKELVAAGKIQSHASFKGAIIYLPGEMGEGHSSTEAKAKKALAGMGL